MGIQEHRANYRAALQVANSDLNEIYREVEQLQLRKEMIENAVKALEPFLQSTSEASFEDHHPKPLPEEPQPEVLIPPAVETPFQSRMIPASFAPVPEALVDPIQSRINRVLGLAVA